MYDGAFDYVLNVISACKLRQVSTFLLAEIPCGHPTLTTEKKNQKVKDICKTFPTVTYSF